jgi:hypothetical protein
MPRARSLAVYVLVAVLSAVALICGLVVSHQREAKLCCRGKALAYWFNQLNAREVMRSPSGIVRRWGCWLETPEASAKAIRGIGTNGIGFYLHKLKRDPGAVEGQIAMAARSVGFENFLFRIRAVDSERGQAATALILLKPLPPEVVSEVVTLSTNGNRGIAAAAHSVLTMKGSDLGLLYPSDSRSGSVDADLYKIPHSALDALGFE